MLLIKTLIVAALLLLFLQDLKTRLVYGGLFPLLAILFVILRVGAKESISAIVATSMVSCLFLGFQLTVLTAYFSFKRRAWVNISHEFLGLGDILFLISLCLYLPVITYAVFYLGSLMLICLFWAFRQLLTKKTGSAIPLAGLQAAVFLVVFITAEVTGHSLTDDTWAFIYLLT